MYCVQQVLSLGYDVLFQDVDIVWYRNPLEFFHQDPTSAMSQHEMYFQDDGSRYDQAQNVLLFWRRTVFGPQSKRNFQSTQRDLLCPLFSEYRTLLCTQQCQVCARFFLRAWKTLSLADSLKQYFPLSAFHEQNTLFLQQPFDGGRPDQVDP